MSHSSPTPGALMVYTERARTVCHCGHGRDEPIGDCRRRRAVPDLLCVLSPPPLEKVATQLEFHLSRMLPL